MKRSIGTLTDNLMFMGHRLYRAKNLAQVAGILCLSGYLLSLSLTALPARAQDSFGVSLQPAIIAERVDPGETATYRFTVTNIDGIPKDLDLLVRDITAIDENGTPLFAEEGDIVAVDRGVSSWVEFPEKSISLGAGEAKSVSFSVRVPADASPGSHLGGIFVVREGTTLRTSGSGVGYEVGTILSLRVAGEIIEEARIRGFETGKSVYSSPEAAFTVRVENLGNVLVSPRGTIDITSMFGTKVATLRVNEDAAAVFPQGERRFDASWKSEKLAFGRYEAVIALTYGEDGKKTATDTLSFWVLPANIILGVLGAIAVLIGGTVTVLRWYIRKKLRDAGVGTTAIRSAVAPRLPFSHLAFVTLSILFFTVVFLGVLFFLFG